MTRLNLLSCHIDSSIHSNHPLYDTWHLHPRERVLVSWNWQGTRVLPIFTYYIISLGVSLAEIEQTSCHINFHTFQPPTVWHVELALKKHIKLFTQTDKVHTSVLHKYQLIISSLFTDIWIFFSCHVIPFTHTHHPPHDTSQLHSRKIHVSIYMKKYSKSIRYLLPVLPMFTHFLCPPLGAHELVVLCVGSWRRCMRNDGGRFRSVLKHNLTWMWWLGLSYKSLFLDILIVMSSVSRCTGYRILGSAMFTSPTTFTTTYSLGLWNQSMRFRSEKENQFFYFFYFQVSHTSVSLTFPRGSTRGSNYAGSQGISCKQIFNAVENWSVS